MKTYLITFVFISTLLLGSCKDNNSPTGNSETSKVCNLTLTQGGINNPKIIIMDNTLGATLSSYRISPGFYYITASQPVFTSYKKTIVLIGGVATGHTQAYWHDNKNIMVRTTNSSNIDSDDILKDDTSLEIRVYP